MKRKKKSKLQIGIIVFNLLSHTSTAGRIKFSKILLVRTIFFLFRHNLISVTFTEIIFSGFSIFRFFDMLICWFLLYWNNNAFARIVQNYTTQNHTVLQYDIPWCIVLYRTALYSTVFWCIILYCSLCTALYFTVLLCAVLHCTAMHCFLLCCNFILGVGLFSVFYILELLLSYFYVFLFFTSATISFYFVSVVDLSIKYTIQASVKEHLIIDIIVIVLVNCGRNILHFFILYIINFPFLILCNLK